MRNARDHALSSDSGQLYPPELREQRSNVADVPFDRADLNPTFRLLRAVRHAQRRLASMVSLSPLHRRRLLGMRPQQAHVEVVLLCIYRHKNVANVLSLLEPAAANGFDVRLWCLDTEASRELAEWTLGCGPGDRSSLLNRLEQLTPTAGAWIVVCDDDVVFQRPRLDLAEFVRLSSGLGLDLSQPAHSWRSHYTHAVNMARGLAIARVTRFVEMGPLLAISPRLSNRVFPMTEYRTMGLGEDLAWTRDLADGHRFGVIDAIQMRHLGPVGASYSVSDSDTEQIATLVKAGGGLHHVMSTVDTWRVWQRRPAWIGLDPGVV